MIFLSLSDIALSCVNREELGKAVVTYREIISTVIGVGQSEVSNQKSAIYRIESKCRTVDCTLLTKKCYWRTMFLLCLQYTIDSTYVCMYVRVYVCMYICISSTGVLNTKKISFSELSDYVKIKIITF